MANDHLNMFAAQALDRGLLDCRPAPVCDPRPVCPACGGLECLCRPRFFAGQLLSEEDLNRLEHYIVAKNRLHNRYLFGTGVVCGLEVVCSPCDPGGGGSVVVKPGYALSPCGNDIVVCKQDSVNICDLIDRCRPRGDDCFHPPAGNDDCDKGTEDWVLAICYQERPSRGITALRGPSCSCGGSGGCGCGCGGGHSHGSPTASGGGAYAGEASCGCGGGTPARTAKTKGAAKLGPRPAHCEPTLTCEGYTFAVYKAPNGAHGDDDNKPVDPGALIKRFFCCLQPLLAQLQAFPPGNATQAQLKAWLQGFIEAMRQFLITEGLYDCDVTAKLNAVPVPAPGGTDLEYQAKVDASAILVIEILVAVFLKCLCSALLPPCPPPAMNDCVPIATVTVTRDRCRVRQVCNISNRRFLITWPALAYWFSWLPLFSSWLPGSKTLRTLIDRLCCTPVAELLGITQDMKLVAGQGVAAPEGVPRGRARAGQPAVADPHLHLPTDTGRLHPFTELLAESLFGARETNAATLILAAMGARNKDDSPLVSDVALQYPGQAMLMHQVVGPALAPLLPIIGRGAGDVADVDSLARSVKKLQKKVDEMDAALRKERKRRPTP